MRKVAQRMGFHFLNYLAVVLVMVVATLIYFSSLNEGLLPVIQEAWGFLVSRISNYIFVSFGAYFMCYIFGLIKYTQEEGSFRIQVYLGSLFKLLVIVGMVSFAEFYIFYLTKIGRLIYLYTFLLLGAYLLIYNLIRSVAGTQKELLWLTDADPIDVFNRYVTDKNRFRIIQYNQNRDIPHEKIEIIYTSGDMKEATSELLIKNKLAGHPVTELVELIEKEAGKIPVEYVDIKWFLDKFDVANRNYFRVNRVLNTVFSIVLITLLFPPAYIFALIHKAFSKGPVFFIQERLGLNGRKFKLIKFRTMVKDAESQGARFAEKRDSRVTGIGRFMRKMRIDEIPQLFNVLKGEMSLVGPRPEREVFIEELEKSIPYYKLRLLVPPGLTGWAQVNGCYAGDNYEDHKAKLEYDLYYIKRRGVVIDFLTLLMTFKTVLNGKGQ